MQHEIDQLSEWYFEKGTPELIEKAQEVCKLFPFLLEKDEDGNITDKSLQAFNSLQALDSSLTILLTIRRRLDSLEG